MVKLATVLAGAEPLSQKTYNDTYRGQILLSDGETVQAIIKDLDDRQLLNELLVASLAEPLELPVPSAFLAYAPKDRLDLKNGPISSDGRLCFASADVKVPNVAFQMEEANDEAKEKLLGDLQAWKGISATVAFDTWVANIDRHGGNLLVGGSEEFWLIDHGHCLTGNKWAPSDFVEDKVYRNRIASMLKAKLDDVEREKKCKEIDAFVAEILSVRVGSCRNASHIEGLLTESERDAAEGFLNSRQMHVSKCSKASLGAESLV